MRRTRNFLSIVFLLTTGLIPTAAQTPTSAEVIAAIDSLGMYRYPDPIAIIDFTLPDLAGTNRSIDSYTEGLVLLNFWATWCGPCRAEMPSMQALYEDYHEAGLEIVAVNLREGRELVRSFIEENDYTFPVLLDGSGSIGYQYNARSIPLTYLVTPDGYVIAAKLGSHDWNSPDARDAIDTLIGHYLP